MNFYHLLEKSKEYLLLAKQYKLNPEEKMTASIELAALLMQMSKEIESTSDQQANHKRQRLLSDSHTRQFFNTLTDKLYRSQNPKTITSHLNSLLNRHGIPKGISWSEQQLLKLTPLLSKLSPSLTLQQIKHKLRDEMSAFILPYDEIKLSKLLLEKKESNQSINLNYLGEATLSNQSAEAQCQRYINLIYTPNVKAISIKLSSLLVHDNSINHQDNKIALLKHLDKICDTCIKHNPNLLLYFDMELFQDLYFTIDIFEHLLTLKKYKPLHFGIALQAYLPQSFDCQKTLTDLGINRVENGGAHIRIRLVKGANKKLESILASQQFQESPLYSNKALVDANFKRMIQYGAVTRHSHAVHLGIGSHNIFDLAFTLIERSEKNTESFISLEMIYGMAPSLYKTLQLLTENILLYTPTVSDEQLDFANAYLFRRIDEQSDPENFLSHIFEMDPGSKIWQEQVEYFKNGYQLISELPQYETINSTPLSKNTSPFNNHSSLNWAYKKEIETVNNYFINPHIDIPKIIPYTIGPTAINDSSHILSGDNPNTNQRWYNVALVQNKDIDDIFLIAKNHHTKPSLSSLKTWGDNLKRYLHKNRSSLCAIMQDDVAKPIKEGLDEINEAIDFINYYLYQYNKMIENGQTLSPKGICLICSPWNFPLAIPTGCIISALICGNAVLFKPAPEASAVGWALCEAFWKAGVPKESLQFIPCDESLTGTEIIKHPELNLISLTGSDETAKLFQKLNPTVELIAETGGKNCTIISDLCDIDEAVEHVLHSAFSYAGQKCSATSIILCHSEILHNSNFLDKLRQACESLITSSSKYKGCQVPPLINKASNALEHHLTQLESGEDWLVKPKQSADNPRLWSPGIKIGVQADNDFSKTECFGPILGIAEINSLEDGIKWINDSKYGLTAGLESLDEIEHLKFIKYCQAGNLYINKPTTGAIVSLQPFGGRRLSQFGMGLKAGGPNYLYQYATTHSNITLHNQSAEKLPINAAILNLSKHILQNDFNTFLYRLINFHSDLQSLTNLKLNTTVIGEDNISYCEPKKRLLLIINSSDTLLDLLSFISFCELANNTLIILSKEKHLQNLSLEKIGAHLSIKIKQVTETELTTLLTSSNYETIRTFTTTDNNIRSLCHKQHHQLFTGPIQSVPRLNCLVHLKEKSISRKKHRYGFIPELT